MYDNSILMHFETGLDVRVRVGLAWNLTGHSRNMCADKIISCSWNAFPSCFGVFFTYCDTGREVKKIYRPLR